MRNPSKTQQPFTMFEHSSNQCLRVVVPTRAFSNIEIIHVNNSQTISYTLAKAKFSEFEVCFLDNVKKTHGHFQKHPLEIQAAHFLGRELARESRLEYMSNWTQLSDSAKSLLKASPGVLEPLESSNIIQLLLMGL